jgi:formylglycine-generating enzyme
MMEKVTVAVMVVVVLSLGNALAADPSAVNGRGAVLRFELVDGTVITGSTDVKVIALQIASGSVLNIPVAELTELNVELNGRGKPQITIRAGETVLLGTVTIKQFRITSPYGLVTVKLNDIRRISPGFHAVLVKGGRWAVDLRDKTRLTGMAVGQSLSVETRCGTIVIPPAHIWKAAFTTGGKSVRVQCRGSDRIVGALGPETVISFTTAKGKVDIPAGKIAALAYSAPMFDLGKGVALKLVRIPAGKFQMGSPKTEASRKDNEDPRREVTISRPFYMGIYEIIQSQWRAVMDSEPWHGKTRTKSGGSYAASHISWNDAVKFCKILSKRTGKNVTLPTEAQWEYACRAGSKAAYCYGDDISKLGDYGWYHNNSGKKGEKYAHAVGRKKANAFGLYDMHGNVWEWCRDYYDKKFYAKAKNVDPENTTKSRYRVVRSGSWNFDHLSCRAAHRGWGTSGFPSGGVRVVVVSGSGVD